MFNIRVPVFPSLPTSTLKTQILLFYMQVALFYSFGLAATLGGTKFATRANADNNFKEIGKTEALLLLRTTVGWQWHLKKKFGLCYQVPSDLW